MATTRASRPMRSAIRPARSPATRPRTRAKATPPADLDDLLALRRAQRLYAGRLAVVRLMETVRLVAGAYRVRVRWMTTPTDGALGTAQERSEREEIAQRLACAGRAALVIADPARQTLWLSRRPLELALRRAEAEHIAPLELVAPLDGLMSADGASITPTALTATAPLETLARVCGPAARLLLFETQALLTLASSLSHLHQTHAQTRAAETTRVVIVTPPALAADEAISPRAVQARLVCLRLDAVAGLPGLPLTARR